MNAYEVNGEIVHAEHKKCIDCEDGKRGYGTKDLFTEAKDHIFIECRTSYANCRKVWKNDKGDRGGYFSASRLNPAREL